MCDFVVSSFVSERHRYDKKKEKKKNGLINEDSSRSVCAVILSRLFNFGPFCSSLTLKEIFVLKNGNAERCFVDGGFLFLTQKSKGKIAQKFSQVKNINLSDIRNLVEISKNIQFERNF